MPIVAKTLSALMPFNRPTRIASQYRILTMHDPEILSVLEADDENISTRDALRAPDAKQFKVAIIKEVTNLIENTAINQPGQGTR